MLPDDALSRSLSRNTPASISVSCLKGWNPSSRLKTVLNCANAPQELILRGDNRPPRAPFRRDSNGTRPIRDFTDFDPTVIGMAGRILRLSGKPHCEQPRLGAEW